MSFNKKCQIIDLKNYLYVVSDDKSFSTSDWVIENGILKLFNSKRDISNCVKVIATTNKSVDLPNLSNSFIQKYVDELDKGNKIVNVMVEYFDCEGTGLSHDSRCETIDCLACNGFLIIDKNNEIIITTMKDSWNREELPIEIIQNMIKYCEHQQIYDKLHGFGDFYYKGKIWLGKNL